AVINKFLERSEEPQPELEVSDNDVCKEITAGQVKVWPKKGKISSGKLFVKYAILNRIGAANWVPTKHTS
ncbi:envelope-like protein, partial [Trifolium medium]|nr:envelope-like protein [Trifolium medium]